MAISVTDIGAASNSGVSSTTVLSGVTVPAGAAILVLASEISGTLANASITDTAGNTYTKIFGPIFLNNSGNGGVTAWLCATATALSSGSITYHKNANVGATISAVYVTGMSSPVIDTAVSKSIGGSKSGQGLIYTLISGSPAGAGEPFFCATIMGPSGNFLNLDTGNGWAHPPDATHNSGTVSFGGGSQINAGTGTKTSAPTETGFFASFTYAGFIIALKSSVTSNTKPKPFVQVFL